MSSVAPAIAVGNTVVAIPSQAYPLAATDFYSVLETSDVPAGVIRIMDIKCPGSGESEKTDWGNLEHLTRQDEVKFVIADRADYEFAREVVAREQLIGRVNAVLFSPVHGELDPKLLSQWVIEDRLPVRVQLQVHKYIWGPTTRGV